MIRLQFAHLPLRTKLVAASALTASIALLIAALTQGVTTYFYRHAEAYEHLNAVARVIAGRSTAAIQSQDFGQAESLVSALRVEPNVEEALLIDSQKRVLMHYAGSKTLLMSSEPGKLTPLQKWQQEAIQSSAHQHRFDGLTALHVVYPITDQGKLIGHLYVRANLSELQETMLVQLAILLGSSVAALALAYLLARRVQRQIASPLLNLVDTMQAAERGDYSKRADVTSDDEIGTLMRGYNVMLAKIESREQELARQQERLEGEVVRTHQEPRRSQQDAAPGHERQRRCLPHRRGREQGQERIPGAHVARNPHADERRARHDGAAARFEARPPPAPLRRDHPELRGRVARDHQRHPRLLEDRSRPAAPRGAGPRHPPGDRGGHRSVRATRAPERHRAAARHRSVPASLGQGRRAAHPPDPHEPGVERAQVHGQRPRADPRARRESLRTPCLAGHRRDRHRHRHPSRKPGGDLRRVRAGRRLHHAPLRRHGTGARDQPSARDAHGR